MKRAADKLTRGAQHEPSHRRAVAFIAVSHVPVAAANRENYCRRPDLVMTEVT
jgi:hypothetical protein